jgi:hypothetical protein
MPKARQQLAKESQLAAFTSLPQVERIKQNDKSKGLVFNPIDLMFWLTQ